MILGVDIRAKRYRTGAPPVLSDLAFSLDAGEIVALVGPSGCGKTTLLRLIAGLDRDYDGAITWERQPRLGFVFQEPRLLPWRTVRENLALVERPDTPPGLAEELLGALGLAAERDTFAARLSLGMARRVALARAFAVEPTLLLLDEPFVSLDETTALQGRELLLAVWGRRPTGVLLVTHDLAEATMLADRILFLSGTPARIEREAVLVPEDRRRGAEHAAALAATLRRSGAQMAATRRGG